MVWLTLGSLIAIFICTSVLGYMKLRLINTFAPEQFFTDPAARRLCRNAVLSVVCLALSIVVFSASTQIWWVTLGGALFGLWAVSRNVHVFKRLRS